MICSVMKARQLSSGTIFLELKMNNLSGRSLTLSTTASKDTNSVRSALCDWPSLYIDGLISYRTQRNLNVPKHLAPFPWLSSPSQPTPAAHRTPALLQNCKDETIQPPVATIVGGGHQTKTKRLLTMLSILTMDNPINKNRASWRNGDPGF